MATPFLSSPDELEARELDGVVTLKWTYPEDFAAQLIVFDIFAAADPADAFRSCVASDVASLEATIGGFERGGTFYFIAVAKRAPLLSLPSRAVVVVIAPPATTREFSGPAAASDTAEPAGLSFPFAIGLLGAVSSEGGSARLRGQILQLLLTSPGERVNVPEFGTRLRDLVFDPNNDLLAASTEFMIKRALQTYLSDEMRVEQVAVSADDGLLQVHIVYLRTSDLQFERVRVGIPLPG